MSNDTLYIKIDKDILVKKRQVTLQDIAKMECTNQAALRQIKQKKIYTFQDKEKERKNKKQSVVFSILKIIELIHEDYPNLDISNEGEQDFIIEYVPQEECVWLEYGKAAVLSVIIFFGAAFTIMAFNNDVGITDVFDKFYLQVMGEEKNGISVLEICYCIGLPLGIIVFFNHFGKKKITMDPTPLQVQMRKYADDIDVIFIENAGRKGHNIDVD